MAWTPFSAEAISLHSQLLRLDRDGRVSEAIEAIVSALDKAHREGASSMTYAQFEEACEGWNANA